MNETLLRWLLIPVLQIAVVISAVLMVVMYLVLLERKVVAFMQVRLGPMRVGWHGTLQPVADVLKLFLKEDITPTHVDRLVFLLAPVIMLLPAMAAFAVIPFSGQPVRIAGVEITPWISDVNVGLLFLLAISSLGVYGVVMAGWSSNSKYPLLGALRSAAQMVSYEVPLGLSVISVLMLAESASMVKIVEAQARAGYWFAFWLPYPQIVGLFLYFVSAVAETNRAPFDLPEAENELVAGFHTEYSGMKFAFFFLAEYMNMILVGCIVTTLFLGGWLPVTFGIPGLRAPLSNVLPFWGAAGAALTGFLWFALKVFVVLFTYLWIRATFPRYRYDQLMRLGWKWLIPLGLAHVMLTGLVMLLVRG
ncbi:MAG: NADH-quinone oxidoreductase subunit NuoH [Acidobacteriia bacterium]|nr:NADH-quinone oxidoreductase subunit NuoH [Terriglobia bacterium]